MVINEAVVYEPINKILEKSTVKGREFHHFLQECLGPLEDAKFEEGQHIIKRLPGLRSKDKNYDTSVVYITNIPENYPGPGYKVSRGKDDFTGIADVETKNNVHLVVKNICQYIQKHLPMHTKQLYVFSDKDYVDFHIYRHWDQSNGIRVLRHAPITD